MRILAKRDNLDASTKLIYSQICEKLGIEQVPLSVALLGNYPKVLSYLWEQSSEIFERNETHFVVNGEVRDKLIKFFQEISLEALTEDFDKQNLEKIYNSLEKICTQQIVFSLWFVALREAFKGIPNNYFSKTSETYSNSSPSAQENLDDFFSTKSEIYKAQKPNSLVLNHQINLPSFFEVLRRYSQKFRNQHEYLLIRIPLEETLLATLQDKYPKINIDYKHFFILASSYEHLGDLWYLLGDFAPSMHTNEAIVSQLGLVLLEQLNGKNILDTGKSQNLIGG